LEFPKQDHPDISGPAKLDWNDGVMGKQLTPIPKVKIPNVRVKELYISKMSNLKFKTHIYKNLWR
jgi:hypothetical protein